MPDAERVPVQKDLDDFIQKATPGLKAFKARAIVERATQRIDSAADDATSQPRSAIDKLKEASEILSSDDAKKYADPETVKKLQSRIVGLQKMAMGKANEAQFEFADAIAKELDEKMASKPFQNAKDEHDADGVAQDVNSILSRLRGAMQDLPADDPHTKQLSEKLATCDKQVAAGVAGITKGDAVRRLADGWKNVQEYFQGWDQETQGPTYQQYAHEQSEKTSSLGMPKTIEAISRITRWLDEDDIKKPAEQLKDDPGVQKVMADAQKTLDAASAKVDAAFNKLMDEIERAPMPTDAFERSRIEPLGDNVGRYLQGTKYKDADVARAKKLVDKWGGTVAGPSRQRRRWRPSSPSRRRPRGRRSPIRSRPKTVSSPPIWVSGKERRSDSKR